MSASERNLSSLAQKTSQSAFGTTRLAPMRSPKYSKRNAYQSLSIRVASTLSSHSKTRFCCAMCWAGRLWISNHCLSRVARKSNSPMVATSSLVLQTTKISLSMTFTLLIAHSLCSLAVTWTKSVALTGLKMTWDSHHVDSTEAFTSMICTLMREMLAKEIKKRIATRKRQSLPHSSICLERAMKYTQ